MKNDTKRPPPLQHVGEKTGIGAMKTWIVYLEERIEHLTAEIAALKSR